MGYVSRALVSGEHVLYTARFHWTEKLAALLLCAAAGLGLLLIARMWGTEMAVTTRRLIYKRGWIGRKAEELTLHRIGEVNLHQSVMGRILGYGNVHVRGMGGGDIALPTMSKPLRFKRALQEAQARLQAPGGVNTQENCARGRSQ